MRRLVPLILVFAFGCSSNDVPFKEKTKVTFKESDFEYKLVIRADSALQGIRISFDNVGAEELVLDPRDTFYEDESGNIIRAANTFIAWDKFFHRMRQTDSYFHAPSGEEHVMVVQPPAEATRLVFKNVDHNKTYFIVALK